MATVVSAAIRSFHHNTVLTLIDRKPVVNSISEGTESHPSILHEVVNNVLTEPPAVCVLQIQRHVPVVQRCQRNDIVLNAGIDDIVVMVNRFLVHWTAAKGHDASPCNGEGISLHTQGCNSCNVLLVHVVIVVRYVCGEIVDNSVSDSVGHHIPNRGSAALSLDSSLNLIRSTSYSPPEAETGQYCSLQDPERTHSAGNDQDSFFLAIGCC